MIESPSINDISSFLARFGLNPSDMARMSNVNDSQMRQYLLGIKHPSDSKVAEIKSNIRAFAVGLMEYCS